MAKEKELFEDSKAQALSHFRTAIKQINDIEHPAHIKDAIEYFARGLSFLDSALKHTQSTSDKSSIGTIRSEEIDKMSNALTGLLQSATIRFGKKQKLRF